MDSPKSSARPEAAPLSARATPEPARRIVLRRWAPEDSISEITSLLHRAYRPQVEMGLQPLAGRQGDDVTAERAANSECWVALLPDVAPRAGAPRERIVGVILFEEHEKVTFPPFFLRPDVAHFAQFAVDPDLQGLGIGRMLLEMVERRARENGAVELALSMAEPDLALRSFYDKRGFRFIEYWQWPYTNYRSCILSKRLV